MCVRACATYTWVHIETREGHQIPWSWSYRWLWVINMGCYELNSGLLEEEQAFLITKLSLQPLRLKTQQSYNLFRSTPLLTSSREKPCPNRLVHSVHTYFMHRNKSIQGAAIQTQGKQQPVKCFLAFCWFSLRHGFAKQSRLAVTH